MTARKIKNLNAYLNAYSKMKYRNVSIYPKIIEKKGLSEFSQKEQKHLTRKGFRWYVYFDFINPQTGKFKRQKPITAHINRNFPEFSQRYKQIHLMKSAVEDELKQGFDPYQESKEEIYSLSSALDFALERKKIEVESNRTAETYESHVKIFKEWLVKNRYDKTPVKEVKKKLFTSFLSYVSENNSNQTRNNYKRSLKALFSILVVDEIVDRNIVKDIPDLKTKGKTDKIYTDSEVSEILSDLKETDPVLLMYIYFVSYMIWRPLECCRMRVKDINFKNKTVSTKTKTKDLQVKLIPEILLSDLQKYLKGANPSDLVFTPTGPGTWQRELDNRRGYFTKRFAAYKKKKGISGTIYGFRHFFITRMFKRIKEEHPNEPQKVLGILANITGHDSKAIFNYIHDNDLSLPEDYSDYLK